MEAPETPKAVPDHRITGSPDQPPDRPEFLDAGGGRNAIHPADVRGRFVRWRRITYFVLIGIYVALPFVKLGDHPAIHLDIPARRFFLLGQAYNAQDAWLIVLLLLAFAFGLVFATSWLGRVWCGWACPQTVFLEGVYRRIERLIEGPGYQQQRLRQEGWTARRIGLLVAKQGAFLLVSLALAHWFLAFFVPVPELTRIVLDGPAGHVTLFTWAMAITGLLQFDFAWFREQMCFIVCPYGRFQSALIDQKSIIIGYDKNRGEPRGKKLKVLQGQPAPARGDCVDCLRCVKVCPTGIDIRNGLQLECIGCAQCIDACDEVMDKLGRARGLIRYDSLLGLAGEKHRILRPRLIAYGAIAGAALLTVIAQVVTVRNPFEANVLRSAGMPYTISADGIRNQLELHLINKHPGPAEFTIAVHAPPGVEAMVPQPRVTLESLESLRTPLLLRVARPQYHGPFELQVELKDVTGGRTRTVTARFLGPLGSLPNG